jgi:hypothetical protein
VKDPLRWCFAGANQKLKDARAIKNRSENKEFSLLMAQALLPGAL